MQWRWLQDEAAMLAGSGRPPDVAEQRCDSIRCLEKVGPTVVLVGMQWCLIRGEQDEIALGAARSSNAPTQHDSKYCPPNAVQQRCDTSRRLEKLDAGADALDVVVSCSLFAERLLVGLVENQCCRLSVAIMCKPRASAARALVGVTLVAA